VTPADVGRRRIQRTTTAGVAGLALAGFAMSYEALHALARDSGVSAELAWLWPLVVDGFIVVASLSVLGAVLESRRSWHPWFLLLIFSSVSVAGNVAHGAPTPVGRLVAAVPPVALVLAFDLLMRQLQLTLRELPDEVPDTAPSLPRSTPSVVTSGRQRAAYGSVSGRAGRLVNRARALGQPVTGRWLAEQLAVSDGYARRLLRQLDGATAPAPTGINVSRSVQPPAHR